MSLATPTPTPTPTPIPNPYGPVVIKPTVVPSSGGAGVPATVSTTTSASVIAAGQNRSAAHNALVLSQTGRKVGGSKKRRSRKSKRSKRRSRKSKRRSRKSKRRSRKSKRSKVKRGGQPTPTPSATPKPTVPVPQFAGAHNDGANRNSLSSNHVAMLAGAQAAYDDPNATPSNTSLP
jgi:hypothetical protein